MIATEQKNQALRQRVVVTFAIDGDLRFLSHLDMVRLFGRALARAELPVCHSQGFNPKPKLWLPLPRSVGMAARREALIVELSEPVDPGTVLEKLVRQIPEGITLMEAAIRPGRKMPRARQVSYTVDLSSQNTDLEVKRLQQAVDELTNADSCILTRDSGHGRACNTIDVRQFLDSITLDRERLRFTLKVSPNGGPRPVDVLRAIGLDPKRWSHRLERTRVIWA